MYDRTGMSTKCTLMKTGFENLRTGTEAKFRPFLDALCLLDWITCYQLFFSHFSVIQLTALTMFQSKLTAVRLTAHL